MQDSVAGIVYMQDSVACSVLYMILCNRTRPGARGAGSGSVLPASWQRRHRVRVPRRDLGGPDKQRCFIVGFKCNIILCII